MGMYEPYRKEFTRRHFLAGSGVVAAAAAGGLAGYVIAQVDGNGAPEGHAATPTPVGVCYRAPGLEARSQRPETQACRHCRYHPCSLHTP
jgi:TAT (twin-arginine translocation) pathway signal sequence